MRTIYLAATAIGFVLSLAACSEAAEESTGAGVLARWHGDWKHRTVVKPAAWTPVTGVMTGSTTGEWILDSQFQQISSHTGKTETREIHRFDVSSDRYHKWAFDSEGNSSFWIGAWDDKSESMTWEYVDFGLGMEGKIVDRFTGADKYETTLILKDGQGNVLLDIRSRHTRTGDRQE